MAHRCPKWCHRCPDMNGDVMPGCWGTVHSNDMADCHCDRRQQRIDPILSRLDKLERVVRRLAEAK
jgi:hypothetical protein